MRLKGRTARVILLSLALTLIPISTNSTIAAGPQTPSCGNFKVTKNSSIVGIEFRKGSYQVNAFGISCKKVMGSKGLFAKFLKLKNNKSLPKPWRYLADAVGAPKFSSGPGVGFRVEQITSVTRSPTVEPPARANATPTPKPNPAQPPPKFSFKFNLDKSLPEDWIAEFKIIMKNLGEIIPISGEINRILKEPFMNIYAWNGNTKNPFRDVIPNASGSSISGNSPSNRWMVLEIPSDEFRYNYLHRYSVIVHETFHVYQISLSKDNMQPKWFSEGGAKAIEEMYTQQYYGRSDFRSGSTEVSASVISNPGLFEEYETSQQIDMNYGSSAFMVLALAKELQKQGISEARAFGMILKDFTLEKSKESDWHKAFTNIFKMTVSDFYQRLSKYPADINQVLPGTTLRLQDVFAGK
jgi:hypothetical protein